MTRLALLLASLLSVGCVYTATAPIQTTPPVIAPTPVVVAPVPVVVAPTPGPMVNHSIANFGSWSDNSAATSEFTTFITLDIGCGDDAAFGNVQAILQQDTRRRIVWTANMFRYGPTARSRGGYLLRPDASACWQELKGLIANHLDRTLGVWLLDEPDSVAWGDMAVSGYDPNLYNDIINTACLMVHADFPALKVGLNYGGVEAGLAPPACLSIVGLEAYGADWQPNLMKLEPLTGAELWLLPPAYTDDAAVADQDVAGRLQSEYAYAKTDPRVTALYPFLWCCDDTTTGNKMFYTASGPKMPLTQVVFRSIGATIKGQ